MMFEDLDNPGQKLEPKNTINKNQNAIILDMTEKHIGYGSVNNSTIVSANSRYCPRFRTCVNIATLPIGCVLYLPIAISGVSGIACGKNLASLAYWKNTAFHSVLSYEGGLPTAITVSLFNLFAHTDFLKFLKV
jgi:hypothetical protein